MGYSTATAKEFVAKIGPIVQKYCKKYGYSVPSAIIAQAICESAAGTSGLSKTYHNYFGLKAGSQRRGTAGVWDGTVANMATKEEYKPGTLTTIKDYFRVYRDMDQGVEGYFEFLMYNRYANLKGAKTYGEFLTMIKNDGYCTSSTYVSTCSSLVKRYDLTKYDNLSYIPVVETPVQNVGNKGLSGGTKTEAEIAKEVISGKWGNGADRKKRLTDAGYNYEDIQKLVNNLLKK